MENQLVENKNSEVRENKSMKNNTVDADNKNSKYNNEQVENQDLQQLEKKDRENLEEEENGKIRENKINTLIQQLVNYHEEIDNIQTLHEQEIVEYNDKWGDLMVQLEEHREQMTKSFNNNYRETIAKLSRLEELKTLLLLTERDILYLLQDRQPFLITNSGYTIAKKTTFERRVNASKRKLIEILGIKEGSLLYDKLKETKIKSNRLIIKQLTDQEQEREYKRRRIEGEE